LRYTSDFNKITNSNKIFLHLTHHFEKSSEIQKENVDKLNIFIFKLKNTNTQIYEVFNVENYLQFIFYNHHVISEILEFWEV
jgi:hypothetical protein